MDLFELTSPLPRLARYVALLSRTTICVTRHQPSILVIQCPSIVLGLWAGVLKQFFRFTLVADLHTEAVCPYIVSFKAYEILLRRVRRAADLCLVSNANLKDVAERTGGKAFVLPDPLPDLTPQEPVVRQACAQVVFVCTYAPDEPYCEVMEAAHYLDPSVTIQITGDYRRVKHLLPPSPAQLTGFLPEVDYVELLRTADVIVDLTCMEDCLVCGGYEAVALEKPLVTSDTAALRDYFRLGTVYTKHDSQSMAAAIAYALAHRDRLGAEMKTLKLDLARRWTGLNDALRRSLQLGAAVES